MLRASSLRSRGRVRGGVLVSCAGLAVLAAACGSSQGASRPPLPVTITSVLSSPGPASGSSAAYLVRFALRGHPGATFTCTVSMSHQGKVVGRTHVEIAGPIPESGTTTESTLVTTEVPAFPAAVSDASVGCTER